MMEQSRRRFLQRATTLGLSLGGFAPWAGCALVPAASRQPAKMPRIGYLEQGPRPIEGSASLAAFRQGLRELGYVEGQNISLEYRNAEGHLDRLPHLAAELVCLNVNVIITATNQATRAATQATTTIPIL
jgi:putative ABC transport system substrate-binding protein